MPRRETRIRKSFGDRLFLRCLPDVDHRVADRPLPIGLYYQFIVQQPVGSVIRPGVAVAGRFFATRLPGNVGQPQIITGYANSLFYAFFGTLISVTLTVLLAYPLSRQTFYGRNILMVFLVFTMLFCGGLIPTYLVVKNLGMLNTRWALLIPQAIAVWQVIITRTFFQATIPEELVEASQLDGCSDLRFLWSVVLPLSKPIIAVLVLMYAVSQWNSYFDALIYLKSAGAIPIAAGAAQHPHS